MKMRHNMRSGHELPLGSLTGPGVTGQIKISWMDKTSWKLEYNELDLSQETGKVRINLTFVGAS